MFSALSSWAQEKLIDSLSKKINQVYRVCIGDAEVGSLNAVQKLVKVESRLVELSDLIESIPRENVEAIERIKQKERRQKYGNTLLTQYSQWLRRLILCNFPIPLPLSATSTWQALQLGMQGQFMPTSPENILEKRVLLLLQAMSTPNQRSWENSWAGTTAPSRMAVGRVSGHMKTAQGLSCAGLSLWCRFYCYRRPQGELVYKEGMA